MRMGATAYLTRPIATGAACMDMRLVLLLSLCSCRQPGIIPTGRGGQPGENHGSMTRFRGFGNTIAIFGWDSRLSQPKRRGKAEFCQLAENARDNWRSTASATQTGVSIWEI